MQRAVVIVGVAMATAVIPTEVAAAPGAASAVFDRTLVCATNEVAGARLVTVWIAPTLPEQPPRAGEIGVNAGPRSGVNANVIRPGTLAAAFAESGAFGGALYDRKQCRPTRTRVPLTAKGLPGPAIRYTVNVICPAPKRVLVHLRYTYVPARPLKPLMVGGRLLTASLAVRNAATGKPIAFGALDRAGYRARLYSAAACETSSTP